MEVYSFHRLDLTKIKRFLFSLGIPSGLKTKRVIIFYALNFTQRNKLIKRDKKLKEPLNEVRLSAYFINNLYTKQNLFK